MRPYEGMVVLDLTHVLAGPLSTYLLGLQGAEVIKIESPTDPDVVRQRGVDPQLNAARMGTHFLSLGANKRCVSLDLKTARGAAVLKRMAQEADVIVQNYRPGAMARLGLSYEDLKAVNPGIVYCSISAYGQQAPASRDRAYDNVIQAASGMMHAGADGEPRTSGLMIVDIATAYTAAYAIATALVRRLRSGQGAHIDCCMFDAALSMIATGVTGAYLAEHDPTLGRPGPEAGLGCYRTADGLLMIGAFNSRQRERFWRLLGHPEFAGVSDFEAVRSRAAEMNAVLEPLLAKDSAAAWEERLRAAGVPAERVRTLPEALRLLEAQGRPFIHEFSVESGGRSIPLRIPTVGFTLDGEPHALDRLPAPVGQHNDEVLSEFGYSGPDIEDLRKRGVIG